MIFSITPGELQYHLIQCIVHVYYVDSEYGIMYLLRKSLAFSVIWLGIRGGYETSRWPKDIQRMIIPYEDRKMNIIIRRYVCVRERDRETKNETD